MNKTELKALIEESYEKEKEENLKELRSRMDCIKTTMKTMLTEDSVIEFSFSVEKLISQLQSFENLHTYTFAKLTTKKHVLDTIDGIKED